MRVFLAGGSGAVGRQLIPQLIAAGHHVISISRTENRVARLRSLGAEALLADVFDRAQLLRVVADAAPDAIINQLTDLPQSMNPRELWSVYRRNDRVRREATRNLLDAAHAAGVERVVAQSVAFWYEHRGGPVKSESSPRWFNAPEPIRTAVRTIIDMEAAVLAEAPIATVLRLGSLYGPGTWYARHGEIGWRVRRRRYPIAGEGVTSFLHVEDAASASVAALAATTSDVFNVADDEPAAASVWMPVYAEAIGAPRPWRVPVWVLRLAIGKPLAEFTTNMRGASNEKIKRELAWRPRYASWRDGFVRAAG